MESFDWAYRLAGCWYAHSSTFQLLADSEISLSVGHAIRYAVELGLHKALPRLSRRKSISAGVESVSDSERALIIGARTWCGLYVFGESLFRYGV